MTRSKTSAGILPYRYVNGALQVLLAHPGGPFWAKKDLGAWSVIKGEYLEGEEPLDAARREFQEETGWVIQGEIIPLTTIKQSGGKRVTAWACLADFDFSTFLSNSFSMEWPPRSGRMQEFPEIDRVAWFTLREAHLKILASQKPLLDELGELSSKRVHRDFRCP